MNGAHNDVITETQTTHGGDANDPWATLFPHALQVMGSKHLLDNLTTYMLSEMVYYSNQGPLLTLLKRNAHC